MPPELAAPDPLSAVHAWAEAAGRRLREPGPGLRVEEHGSVVAVGESIATLEGLPDVRSEELVELGRGVPALALDLREDRVGVALLGERGDLAPGDEARRTGRVLDVPVGEELLGRVIDPLGRPRDDRPAPRPGERRAIEQEAPAIMDRAPVTVPLMTGLKVVDALVPIGRGQRQLLVGDRQTGKTAIAIDAIINQRDTGVRCVYCAIGQRASATAGVVRDLRTRSGLDHVAVVATSEEDPPGLRYAAPYAAMAIAEWFMHRGEDALLVLDDMTRHARAWRELSLLLRRPPGREAYPGDVFHVHARLLERSTHLRDELGGGSLTALPVVQTEAQDVSAYIPTNLISITDGQVLLSPRLFREGVLPAVDVGRSVSRVGGKTQFPAYRDVAGDLRLAYSQFEELESFSRFASRLDEETRATLEHGRRVRAILEQRQYDPMPVLEQLALLLAVSEGLMDEQPVESVDRLAEGIRARVRERHREIGERIEAGEDLRDQDREALLDAARAVIAKGHEDDGHGEHGEHGADGGDGGHEGARQDRGDAGPRRDRRTRRDAEDRGDGRNRRDAEDRGPATARGRDAGGRTGDAGGRGEDDAVEGGG